MPNFLDIEASGLHFDSYPIEIALSLDGKLHSWLIRPVPQWTYWSEQAKALHGLTREQLMAQGLPVVQVAQEINQLLLGADGIAYCDALAWDEDWINTLFHAANEVRYFHLLPCENLFVGTEHQRFMQTLRNLQVSGCYRHHRAGPDVQMMQEAYSLIILAKHEPSYVAWAGRSETQH